MRLLRSISVALCIMSLVFLLIWIAWGQDAPMVMFYIYVSLGLLFGLWDLLRS